MHAFITPTTQPTPKHHQQPRTKITNPGLGGGAPPPGLGGIGGVPVGLCPTGLPGAGLREKERFNL